MPRPIKPRRIGYIPQNKLFVPYNNKENLNDSILLLFDELEAMRLKDIENLDQSECALIMDVSRQTFQLIIDSARKKVATSLIEGKPLKIEGGHYIMSNCAHKCQKCGEIYQTEKFQESCPRKKKNCQNCQNNH